MKQIVLHLFVGDLQNKGVTVIPAKARNGRSSVRQTPQGAVSRRNVGVPGSNACVTLQTLVRNAAFISAPGEGFYFESRHIKFRVPLRL